MTYESWTTIRELFHDAAALPKSDRLRYLENQSAGPDVMAEVLSLLEEDGGVNPVLDDGLAAAAFRMLESAEEAPEAHRMFGPYHVERLLGVGGTGTVFLGRRKDLGSVAAIKILRDAWLSPVRRERFLIEQRMLSQLNHPAIARLYDAGVSDEGTPWFAMEYVDGVSVTDFCRDRRLSIPERLMLFREVCKAVQFAHEHAVIHRDLKPANVFVTADGSPKLLDFGIAKQLETLDQPAYRTRTEFRMMTPAFAAPEQRSGRETGAFTDVYALGLILYILLSGRHPFESGAGDREDAERPSSVRGRELNALDAGKADWADLDVLCLTAIRSDEERRYRSVEALLRDIEHYLAAEPLEARADSFGYRARKFASRNRTRLLASAAITVLAIGGMSYFTVSLSASRNAALAAVARAQLLQEFTQNLFDGGEKAGSPAKDLLVSALLSRGEQQADLLSRDVESQSDLYRTLGKLYQKLGDFGQADKLLGKSLALAAKSGKHQVESLLDHGLLRIDEAKLTEAEKDIRTGLAINERTRPEDRDLEAKLKIGLGRALKEEGRHAQSLVPLKEAEAMLSSQPASLDLAAAYKQQAEVYFYSGQYGLAERYQNRALKLHRRLLGADHVETADDLVNLGAFKSERGDPALGERYYRQALPAFERWYGKDHLEAGGVLYLLGKEVLRQSRFDEAEAILTRALRIRERSYGPRHPFVANTLAEICTLELRRHQDKKAESCFARQRDIYRSAYGDKHHLVAVSMVNLADVYLDEKKYLRAERTYREALRRYGQTVGPEHVYNSVAELHLGEALVAQRRYAEAKNYLEAAYRIRRKIKMPGEKGLQKTREYLALVYAALNEPERAREMRAEMEGAGKPQQ